MTLTTEQRREAALKGAETRRKNKLALQASQEPLIAKLKDEQALAAKLLLEELKATAKEETAKAKLIAAANRQTKAEKRVAAAVQLVEAQTEAQQAIASAPIAKPTKAEKRSRRWCFTLNNYTEEEETAIQEFPAEYLIYGREICPTTGTRHLQGYIRRDCAYGMSNMKKHVNKRAHWSSCNGTEQENINYCSKDGNVFSKGTPAEPGKRTDCELVLEMCRKGAKMIDIIESGASYTAIKTAELYKKYDDKKRDWKPEVVWVYGDPGSGKTTFAYKELKDQETWSNSQSSSNGSGYSAFPFEGYEGEENILFEEFRKHQMSYDTLLRTTDATPFKVMVKNGSRQLLAKRVWFCCVMTPVELYANRSDKDIAQVLRRIDRLVHMKSCTVTGTSPLTMSHDFEEVPKDTKRCDHTYRDE